MCERLKMEAPTSSSHLQNILRRVVQTVQWSYTIYWKLCSTQRILAWSDGYYNGAIKTRKTVQLKEVSAEEASLHRSQQLRELYETLCAGEANQQTKRPSAALSPEDLTETEWFYMMCFSYYFPLAVGLPGRAYAKRQHVWLTGANGVDSQVFSRAILAKSAQIQTVICIPLLDGVVELGTTEKVYEDLGLIQQIINFFIQSHESQQQLPKQALSEHSTSDPPTFSGFRSSDVIASPAEYITVLSSQVAADTNNQTEKEEEEEDGSSDDLSDTSIFNDIISSPLIQNPNSIRQTQTQISDHMQIDDMDSDYHILRPPAARQIGNQETIRTDENEYLGFQPSPPGTSSFHELAQEEDAHYSKTVALILPAAQSSRCSGISTATNFINPSPHSAFFNCSSAGYSVSDHLFSGSSQRQLKYILFTVPFLHSKDSGGTSQIDSYPRKAGTPQEVLMGGANHVLVERRRREKLNERFIMLRSLVPFVTKMDKASILGDTIEYVKQLRRKIEELEAQAKQVECIKENNNNNNNNNNKKVKVQSMINKKKMRLMNRGKLKGVAGNEEEEAAAVVVQVEVSIIDNNALVELQCRYREGLLLDIMQMLKYLKVEITAVQSSLSKGFFMAEMKAKIKENINGKKVTIMEVKKALLQTVSQQEQ